VGEFDERVASEDELVHYGTPRHSGRYPWGSGQQSLQRGNKSFLDRVAELKKQGLSETEIAKGMGMSSTSELRARASIEKARHRQAQASQAFRLSENGLSNVAIGQKMGLNESSVRALLNPALKAKRDSLQATADVLKSHVDSGGFLDVGKGSELHVGTGITATKLATAVEILKQQGYVVRNIQVAQQFGKGKTTIKVLAPPGFEKKFIDPAKIGSLAAYSDDGGHTYEMIKPPVRVSSSRIAVRHAGEGGEKADGVIYLRPGVPDISLGTARYAQVRIAVDRNHFMKGMAMYKDDLPHGVDMLYNTSKKNTGNKMDALKAGKEDEDTPWTTLIKHQRTYIDAAGKVRQSAINIVNEEGDWKSWKPSLSSQILSKQSPALAKRQLDLALAHRRDDLDEIRRLTNPVIKKKLLETFGDEADSAAVHLKAAALPGQGTHVILPLSKIKPDEVYAPNFANGTRVALIRHPHGGTFEIPELTVNNRNPEGRASLGTHAIDAIGMHHSVATRLSGADFDGDAVLVIPNKHGALKTSPPLAELQSFDPKVTYPKYPGMKVMTDKMKQQQMGDVSNLITDMTIRGAGPDEIARAVKHSMVVIDAVKHELNYKQSREDNAIDALKAKYQGINPKTGKVRGASTIISKASSEVRVPDRRPRPFRKGGPIDVATGQKVFEPTGKTTLQTKVNKRTGAVTTKVVPRTIRSTKLAEVANARELSSGLPMEEIYAAHSNALKAMANRARLESLRTEPFRYNPSAARTYSKEVARLNAALNIARKNAPLERQAQLLANNEVSAKIHGQRHTMDPDDIKKIQRQALETARARVGARKHLVQISDEEWRAIQSGAISTHKLRQILDNSDLDRVKALATPRRATVVTPARLAIAKLRLASGYSQAEVAASLGIPVSTLNSALIREGV
jgi:DNA-binding CsgD family transcriptional regulator